MTEPERQNLNSLRELTVTILDPARPPYSLREEVTTLTGLLTSLGTYSRDPETDISAGQTLTAGGLAISPCMAAMCADDYVRTVVFLRGLHDAIQDVSKKNESRPVRILYAGCGPLALLALPLMAVFNASEARFTLLDIHQESTDSVAAIITQLGLEEHMAALLTADALEHQVNEEEQPDIILLEMLRSILEHEPQVAVTRHLVGQAPGAVLIPDRIDIDLELVDPAIEFSTELAADEQDQRPQERVFVGTAFTLDKDEVSRWGDDVTEYAPGNRVITPEHDRSINLATLFTRICTYGEHVLGDYDSGLTSPRVLQLDLVLKPGDELTFYYRLGQNPGLVWAQ